MPRLLPGHRGKRRLGFRRGAHASSDPSDWLKHPPLLKGPGLGLHRSDFALRHRLSLCPAPAVDERHPGARDHRTPRSAPFAWGASRTCPCPPLDLSFTIRKGRGLAGALGSLKRGASGCRAGSLSSREASPAASVLWEPGGLTGAAWRRRTSTPS
ncbi:hypothetical protein P7K49_002334 [Saguinus oedipus]|uniref:Uncharacterized protein n=1 Tax=Saguinus oedipus TaxID=9490 RepID=A0ABQ9WH34_SAGOE|nr:hypothetical protein P7K49_002334 [Saguinus oedipus]